MVIFVESFIFLYYRALALRRTLMACCQKITWY